MNQLEDRLRQALGADMDVPDLLADVHTGARRRRARRTTGVVAVAAAAAVATIGLVVSLGHETTTKRPAPPVAPPPVGVVDVADGDGRLLALTPGAVWQQDDNVWAKLHEFGGDGFQYLVASPDGTDAWAWGNRLWSTHDGGHTWQVVQVPGDPTYGYHVWTTQTFGFVQTADRSNRPQFFRFPLGSDVWDMKLGPGFGGSGGYGDLLTAGNTVAFLTYLGEDTSEPVLRVGEEDFHGSGELPLPCSGENTVYPADTEVFTLCPRGDDGATVYRTTGMSRWEEFGTTTGVVKDVEALSDDALLVVGADSVMVTPSGTRPVTGDLGDGAWGAATVGDASYVAAQDGRLLVSRDGGLTWTALE